MVDSLQSHAVPSALEPTAEGGATTAAPLSPSRRSADLLETVLAGAPLVLWEVDAEGVFTLSAGRGLDVLGLKPGEVLGTSVFELYADHTEILADVRRALQGEAVRSSVELNGLYFDSCYSPVRDELDGIIGARGVATVITQQREAERALEQSEERFATAFHSSPLGILFSRLEDGVFIDANDAFLQMCGYACEEIVGRSSLELNMWSEPAERQRFVGMLDERGTIRDEEFHFRTKQGEPVVGRLSAEVIELDGGPCLLTLCDDITEKKRAEEAAREMRLELHERERLLESLAESEARWKSVVEDAPDFILIVNREGQIKYINHTVPPLTRADVEGKPVFAFVPHEYHDMMREAIATTCETGQIVNNELAALGPNETQAWYSNRIGPVRVGEKIVAASIVARDVTRKVELEEKMRRRQDQLAHVARLSTMGEMASTLAHEVNQHLAAISNYAAGCALRLADGPVETGELIEAARAINRQAGGASETLDRVLAFVRNRKAASEPVGINHVIAEAVELAASAGERQHIEIAVETADDLPKVTGDRVQLEQVVLNLLMNAIESLEESPAPLRRLSVRSSLTPDGCVEVAVCDNGCGLPQDYADWIFEPFQTSKPRGTGMGLSISRSIVEYHQGRLTARPNEDRGATFVVALPAAPGEEVHDD